MNTLTKTEYRALCQMALHQIADGGQINAHVGRRALSFYCNSWNRSRQRDDTVPALVSLLDLSGETGALYL